MTNRPTARLWPLLALSALLAAPALAEDPTPAPAALEELPNTASLASLTASRGHRPWLSLDQPADQPPAQATPAEPASQPLFGPGHQRSWELPAVVVEGQPTSTLKEEERVGSYGQPRWTTTRRFPSTRVYVIPEGKVEVEGWARGTFNRDDQGGNTEWRFLQEVEVGLPYRFQLDLYLRQDYDTGPDDTLWGGQFEVRWALADWGKIWGNPTLYFEYITLEDRPDKIEPKLLLGGEVTEGWHWGVNLVFEYEISGPEREAEYSITSALSRTIIDKVLSLGVETVFAATDVKDERGDFNTSFVIGPSIQWHPVPSATINIAPLFGVTNESPVAQVYFNIGWEF